MVFAIRIRRTVRVYNYQNPWYNTFHPIYFGQPLSPSKVSNSSTRASGQVVVRLHCDVKHSSEYTTTYCMCWLLLYLYSFLLTHYLDCLLYHSLSPHFSPPSSSIFSGTLRDIFWIGFVGKFFFFSQTSQDGFFTASCEKNEFSPYKNIQHSLRASRSRPNLQ